MHEVYLRQRTFKSTSDIIRKSNTHKTTTLFKMKSTVDMGIQKNKTQQSQPQTYFLLTKTQKYTFSSYICLHIQLFTISTVHMIQSVHRNIYNLYTRSVLFDGVYRPTTQSEVLRCGFQPPIHRITILAYPSSHEEN